MFYTNGYIVGARRAFGTYPLQLTYPMGSVLRKGAEEAAEVELEYCSLIDVPLHVLPLRMMKFAVPFITACLNSRLKGTIGFGVVGRENKENTTFSQVVGIPVKKNMIGLIESLLTDLLNHHIETKSFSKLDRLQRDFIKVYPIKVTYTSPRDDRTVRLDRCVFEIDVCPRWDALSTHFFYCWWFSEDHDDLLGPKAYRVYQNEPLIDKERKNRMLVERRNGQTCKRDASQETVFANEVKQKCQQFKQNAEKKSSASSGLVCASFLLLYIT